MIQTTIITPTTGSDALRDACQSVASQTVECLHLLVVDGQEHQDKVYDIAIESYEQYPATYNFNMLILPHNTGGNGHYGHKIYAGVPSLTVTPFFSFLDEDNWIEHNWVHKMQEVLFRNETCGYVTCRRTVIDEQKNIIGYDNKESVGENEMGYRLYDTNTWLFRYNMALLTPYISLPYHKGDNGSWGGDRSLTETLWKVPHVHLEDYHGTYYRSPERLIQFFKEICDEKQTN